MIDIVEVGNDIGLLDTQIARARNILSVQIESLEYAPDLGIDLKYFLSENFKFQNESFRAYLIQVLAIRGINVATLDETLESLFAVYNFNLSPIDESTGLIAG